MNNKIGTRPPTKDMEKSQYLMQHKTMSDEYFSLLHFYMSRGVWDPVDRIERTHLSILNDIGTNARLSNTLGT